MLAFDSDEQDPRDYLKTEYGGITLHIKPGHGNDASVIATLEERLKESASPGSAEVDDIEGEDLNDEISTSRKDLYYPDSRGGELIVDDSKLFDWNGSLRRLKQQLTLLNYLLMAMARMMNYKSGSSSMNQNYLQPTKRSQNVPLQPEFSNGQ